MNQILQVKDTNKQLEPIGVKKVLLFLLIIAIIAGLSFGIYYTYINIVNGNIQFPIFVQVPEETIEINFEQTDRNKLIINVQGQTGIAKVEYSLNNGERQNIEVIQETFVEETLEGMPTGENTISIFVEDINGKQISKQETFIVEAPKPVIDLSVIGNDIKITVTSEVELSEISYTWNLDNPKKENMITYENKLSFEKQLEIPIGQNTLKIIATDINGGTAEKNQEIKGITKATTTTEVIGEYLHFTVVGKENIDKVEFIFNGQKFLMNTQTFGETKTVHYKVKLIEGKNYLTVTSTTQSGGTDTKLFEQEYNR